VKSVRRIVNRLLLATAAVMLGGSVAAYLTLAGSLPRIDGELPVEYLHADATIARDAAGIPTITADNRRDLAFATGFAHGQDRYFQMDLTRRQAAGELAAIVGPAALALDQRNRFHRFRSRARAALARASAEETEIFDAYAAGVNAGLLSLGSRPFEYFLLHSEPLQWLPEDSVLVAYAMFMELNDERAQGDVQRGLAYRALPHAVYDWLYPQGTEWDAPVSGEAILPPAIPAATVFDLTKTAAVAAALQLPEVDSAALPGSNNWAVGGAVTRSGRAIVANDMHLGITVPNVFYRARLVVSGKEARDVSGVTLPGVPIVVTGSNGRVAWGFTNSYGDWSDAVLLRPGAEPGTYLTPDGPRQFERHRELIEIRGAAPLEFVVRETIWGPVLDDVDYPDGELAVSWIAHYPEAVNLRYLDLETATSVSAALQVANRLGLPPQNFVSGDSDGNIGWTIAGRIPRRSDYDPLRPADWSDAHGWSGWLAPEDYPRIENPATERIWTANARVVDGEALRKVGDGGYDLGARAGQIRDTLFAKDNFEPLDMLQIQVDDRALFLQRWRELLLTVLSDDVVAGNNARDSYRKLVQNWVPRASAPSVGYRLVRAFRISVRNQVFDMLTAPLRAEYGDKVDLRLSNQFEGPLWALMTEQPKHLLSGEYDSWDALLLAAVDANLSYFGDNFEGGLEQRSWGERNTAAIRHPLSGAVPLLSRWLDMPRDPLPGDWNMPRAQSPDFGASERFAVSPGDEQNGYLHMPAGQSGHPMSEFYRAGHDDWVRARPAGFLPGPTRHTLRLRALTRP